MRIISNFGIYSLPEYKEELEKGVEFPKKKKEPLFFVLKWRLIPWLVRDKAWTIKQRNDCKPILKLPDSSRLKQLIFGKYDVYMTANLYSIDSLLSFIITTLRRKKNVIFVKEFHYRKENMMARVGNILARLTSRSDFFIAYSRKSEEFLVNSMRIPKYKVYHIPKPCKDYAKITYEKVELERTRDRFFSKKKKNILFIGRIIPVKGIDVFLRSIKPFKDKIHLVIAGDDSGRYAEKCKELVKGLDVTFTGKIGNKKGSEEVVYFYRNADLFVLPNKYVPKEYEAVEVFGSVIDEAEWLSLPVIATTATGCSKDSIKGTGKVVKEGSVEELTKTIMDFLENPKKWEEMGKKGPSAQKEKNRKNYEGWKKLFGDIEKLDF